MFTVFKIMNMQSCPVIQRGTASRVETEKVPPWGGWLGLSCERCEVKSILIEKMSGTLIKQAWLG